jgi:amino acid adenylation domain-containing protein
MTASAPDTLVGLLHAQVRAHPGATAVEDEQGRSLTYAQVDECVGRLAGAMREAGVTRGDRVGVCMPKSINSYLCLQAAMRAGAAYVPVDYSAPAERNRYIFNHCRTRVVCADAPRAAALRSDAAFEIPLLTIPGAAGDGIGAAWMDGHDPRFTLDRPVTADDLSYILYTSGSTGRPKGVVHTHASALSFVDWSARTYQPAPEDRFSSHAPFHFDLSVFDLYVPMTCGAALVIISEAGGKEPKLLAQFIAERRISVWYSVPSILAMMAQFGQIEKHDYANLRLVLFAGEVFPVKHLRMLREHWPRPGFHNLYGPTETNVCTAYAIPDTIPADRDAPYPIGAVCDNCEGVVLDDAHQPVEGGGEGILHIHASGPVMKEYWALPEENAACFHVDAAGRKWYRTGDVVHRDADGHFVFVGRRDRMVKRRGYRIELGEIEAGLYRHPSVREAAAVSHETADGVNIIAFLSAKPDQPLSIIAMKQYCAKELPAYMNPDRFTFMPDLPRTSTGKVDYQALRRSLP